MYSCRELLLPILKVKIPGLCLLLMGPWQGKSWAFVCCGIAFWQRVLSVKNGRALPALSQPATCLEFDFAKNTYNLCQIETCLQKSQRADGVTCCNAGKDFEIPFGTLFIVIFHGESVHFRQRQVRAFCELSKLNITKWIRKFANRFTVTWCLLTATRAADTKTVLQYGKAFVVVTIIQHQKKNSPEF